MRLNLGAGSQILSGWINVDQWPLPGVNRVWDLNERPWPFESNSADQIVAKDVFEHVDDAVLFMTECHRILRPGAGLFIQCPYYKGRDAFTDPTHKRFPTEHTFDYWVPGTLLYAANNAAYGGVAFTRRVLEVSREKISTTLVKTAA